MVRRYYQLPSLTSLAVFESSARHLNFSRAASELNVTRGAVSRQIKTLEDEVGVPLFNRDGEGILLTPEGEDLYGVLARGFSEASEALHRIRAGQRQEQVTLACSNAFASLWLMPRIGAFWRSHPKIVVDHLISDDPRQLRQAAVNLRIRYGAGDWPDENAQLLFAERIFLVCGPGYAEGRETDRNIETLDLLHVDDVDPEWTGWDEFLRRAGVSHGPLLGRRLTPTETASPTGSRPAPASSWTPPTRGRIPSTPTPTATASPTGSRRTRVSSWTRAMPEPIPMTATRMVAVVRTGERS